jgi:hypothetical protein
MVRHRTNAATMRICGPAAGLAGVFRRAPDGARSFPWLEACASR